MDPLRDASLVRCSTCKNYAWIAPMRGVRDAAGEMHHLACPTLPGREQRLGLGDAVFEHVGEGEITDALVLDHAHEAVQVVANVSSGSALGKIAEGAVQGAAEGAAIGVVSAAVISAIAAELAIDLDMAIAVAASVATTIGVGAGAGAGLGGSLGPIGAVVGVIVGVVAALIGIGGAQGANAGWCDPTQGTLLLTTVRYFLESHPVNPLVAIMATHDPGFTGAIASAVGPRYDWADYEATMHNLFETDKSGLHFVALNKQSTVGAAFVDLFASLAQKGVPKSAAMKIVGFFADFSARMRGAEHKFTTLLPGPIGDRKLGPRVFQNESEDCRAWQKADLAAASAFFGANISNIPISAQPDAGWNQKFHDAEKRGAKWPNVSSSRYYKDIHDALSRTVDEVYAQVKAAQAASAKGEARSPVVKRARVFEKAAIGAGFVGVLGFATWVMRKL